MQQQRRSGTGSPDVASGLGHPHAADRITEGAMQLLYVAWQDLTENAQRVPGGDLERALACVHDAIGDLREIADDLRHRPATLRPAQVPSFRRGLQRAEDLSRPARTTSRPYIAQQTA